MKQLISTILLLVLSAASFAAPGLKQALPQVFDANGGQIGNLIDVEISGDDAFVAFPLTSGLNAVVRVNRARFTDGANVGVRFANNDCTGTIYASANPATPQLIDEDFSVGLGPNDSVYIGDGTSIVVNWLSRWFALTGTCLAEDQTGGVELAVEVIAPNTFTTPYILKLE